MVFSQLLVSFLAVAAVSAIPLEIRPFNFLAIRQGQTDSGITNTPVFCTGGGGKKSGDKGCASVLANANPDLCLTLPGHGIAGEVVFALPPPTLECFLFKDTKCGGTGTAVTGAIGDKAQLSWKCGPPGEVNSGGAGGGNNNGGGKKNAANNNGGGANNNNNNGGGKNNNNNGGGGANNNGGGGKGRNNNALPTGNVSNFGTCPPPQITFARGLPGRNKNELGFAATDQKAYPHDAALNIAVITDSIALDGVNRCGLKNGDPAIDVVRRAEAAALAAPKGGKQADEFNRVIGFQTNFANVK